uniref:Tetraspanin n=1 Tax=Globodera pallida TaxID=36090 RepID=A0A183C471_GLOPA
MSSSFCINCSRILLVVFGVLLLLFGFALLSLTLWVRSDQKIEKQLRQTLFSDPALAPHELVDTKLDFRFAYVTLFWALVGISSVLAMVGFFAVCGGCSPSWPVNGLLLVMLFVLILLQLILFLSFAFFRDNIMDSLGTYISISQQYNLPDATVFRERFACCGDGNYQMSYNFHCQGLGQPSCRQVLENGFRFVLTSMSAFVGLLVLFELIAAAICAVLICHHKNNALEEMRY